MKSQVEESFSLFFQNWMGQLEEHVNQLSKMSKLDGFSSEAELRAMVFKVTTHYKELYTVKWAKAHEDVLAFFSPVWLTPLESTYTWFTGWKPSMAFRVVYTMLEEKPAVVGIELTEEQARKIEQIRVKVKAEEEKVEREMERQQVGIAGRRMVELAKFTSGMRNEGAVGGGGGKVEEMVEVAVRNLLGGLERVMKGADCVRLKTMKWVLDELSPLQCIHFLASISMIRVRLRQWGKRHLLQLHETD